MKYLFTILLFAIQSLVYGQNYKGMIHEDYTMTIVPSDDIIATPRQSTKSYEQIAGFPKGFRAFENSKNFRNVTLEDIDNDGIQEILFAAASTFVVMSKGEILWKKPMVGIGIYPPSIADIDNDGDLEIVQATGGNGLRGRLYAWDHTGKNLPNFPKSINDNWILTSPTLSDLDGDQQLEIIFLELDSPGGRIHIIKNDGTPWSKDWPLRLANPPAITPSIADIDNDGQKEIVAASTRALFVFNLEGELEEGWPKENPDSRYSYQSPLLVDLDDDGDLEIVGAAHGDVPQFYIYNHDGIPYKIWPFFVPEQSTSFSTPSIVQINDEYQIIMSRQRPIGSERFDMLYAWNEAGELKKIIDNPGGLHGIISVADIDEEPGMELIFGSNNLEESGLGYIHAFNSESNEFEELDGFPLRPKGWTLLNGAALGDVDGDGQMDLTALSYTTNLGTKPDSIFINVYNLETPYNAEKIHWTTYKGSNSRDGNLAENLVSNLSAPTIKGLEIKVFPNPINQNGIIELKVDIEDKFSGDLFTSTGQLVQRIFDGNYQKGTHNIMLPKMSTGLYFLKINSSSNKQLIKKITAFSN